MRRADIRVLAIFSLLGFSGMFPAGGMTSAQETLEQASTSLLIPQQLLPLVHAPQVQQELELSAAQINELETYFKEHDGAWFRGRILPAEKSKAGISQLENEFWTWTKTKWKPKQIERLKQLELQALGSRLFLRKDVETSLGLTSTQVQTFTAAARATESAQRKLQAAQQKGEEVQDLNKQYQEALAAEQKVPAELLTAAQKKQFSELVGPTFDTQGLKRIFPMAPEFATGTEWINSSPLSLEKLKGKVVLVHFYAFQCHNCHANFEIYRRWHEKYQGKDVVVIGIQSPETKTERDPQAVKKAAIEKKLDFPIIIDTEMKNWNNWSNTMWPTVYVIDKRGYLRHWWQGELNWQGATGDKVIEDVVATALQEE